MIAVNSFAISANLARSERTALRCPCRMAAVHDLDIVRVTRRMAKSDAASEYARFKDAQSKACAHFASSTAVCGGRFLLIRETCVAVRRAGSRCGTLEDGTGLTRR